MTINCDALVGSTGDWLHCTARATERSAPSWYRGKFVTLCPRHAWLSNTRQVV